MADANKEGEEPTDEAGTGERNADTGNGGGRNDSGDRSLATYFGCIALFLLVPLAPLLVDLIYKGNVTVKSMYISAAMYAFSNGASSTSAANFLIGLAIGFFMSLAYGAVDPLQVFKSWTDMTPLAVIFLVLVMAGFERYKRHVTLGEKPFKF